MSNEEIYCQELADELYDEMLEVALDAEYYAVISEAQNDAE